MKKGHNKRDNITDESVASPAPRGGFTSETGPSLLRVIERQPFLDVNPSKEGAARTRLSPDTMIYFGTGICSHMEVSRGTPLDMLSMILTSESLRRKLGLKGVYHNIANSHALTNNFDPLDVERMTAQYEKLARRVKELFGMKDYEVVRASDFDQETDYKEILSDMVESNEELSKLHNYAKQEIADIEFFRRKGANLKIGWTMGIKDSQYDESFYDRNFKQYVSNMIGFLYIVPGKSFDKRRPRVAPYVDFNPEKRLMIPDNEAERKIDVALAEFGPNLNGAKSYYTDMARLWREFDDSIPMNGTMKERVRHMLRMLS
jgi:hypothetical protein